jgi:hypothetical protein
MPASRPTYLEGEDIVLYVDIDSKYLTDVERLFAYVHFDDDHHLLTSTEAEFIQMEPDYENSRVKIHIDHAVTANPDIMPVGIWKLEILTVYNETEYHAIYQNLKQFELKKSYIVFSGDVFINQSIKMTFSSLKHYRGETVAFHLSGDDVFSCRGSNIHPENNPKFRLFIYPDGTDVSTEEGQALVKIIKSTVLRQTDGEDGYVEFAEGQNEVQCILPYIVTRDLAVGKYTMELLYGSTERSVIKRTSAFTLLEAASQEIVLAGDDDIPENPSRIEGDVLVTEDHITDGVLSTNSHIENEILTL